MKFEKTTSEDFDLIYSEMEKNFIREEIRSYESAFCVMNEKQYSIHHITKGTTRVGFLAVWELSGFAFIEHFVIYDQYRCKGYGAEALGHILKKFGNVVLEVEPPHDELKARRIAFYKRCGFVENSIEYAQPPYRQGDEAVKLLLLSYPEKLTDAESVKGELYRSVYKINI